MLGKVIDMAPWEGTWSRHQRMEGMTVPMTGEIAWLLPVGRKTCWRVKVTSLRLE